MRKIKVKRKIRLMKKINFFNEIQIKRFWYKVVKSSDNECWEHSGSNCTIDKKRWKVGRVSWIIHFGEVPKGMDVRKTCSNRKCVNPNHLFLKPTTIDETPFLERFWTSIEKTDECWVWNGRRAKEGYGLISDKGKCYRANRVSYEIHKGPIPEGLLICHTCHNPECVNPDHLYAGTPKENTTDMMLAMRHPVGEDNYNAILTADDVMEIRKTYIPRKVSQGILAEKYGVSVSTINAIIARRIWKHIE